MDPEKSSSFTQSTYKANSLHEIDSLHTNNGHNSGKGMGILGGNRHMDTEKTKMGVLGGQED
jgi:hypothetical protein